MQMKRLDMDQLDHKQQSGEADQPFENEGPQSDSKVGFLKFPNNKNTDSKKLISPRRQISPRTSILAPSNLNKVKNAKKRTDAVETGLMQPRIQSSLEKEADTES